MSTSITDREKAIISLAEILYAKMEHLDPSAPGDFVEFNALPERQRDFYRLCVEEVFSHHELVRRAALAATRGETTAGAGE